MDDLMDRYAKLSNQTTFNPETFANEWRDLASDFDKDGRHSMAAGCLGKADWYAGRGHAQKLAYTDITPVQADYVGGEKMLPCGVCDTWTKHVKSGGGWACGCGEFTAVHNG